MFLRGGLSFEGPRSPNLPLDLDRIIQPIDSGLGGRYRISAWLRQNRDSRGARA